ncbi:MAG: tetratricopeptide repeat protein [Actinomycetota bacterium]
MQAAELGTKKVPGRNLRKVTGIIVGAVALLLIGGTGFLRSTGPGADVSASAPAPETLLRTTLAGGDADAAVATLQERVRLNPEDAEALTSLGLAEVQRARSTADPAAYPRAEQALLQAQRLERADGAPTYQTLVGLGALSLARHDFSAAERHGRAAAELNPFDGDVFGVIGDAQIELGRYNAAFSTFQRMVDTEPGVAAYSRVSYARELQGDTSGAIEAMTQAESAAGSASDAAWAAFHTGELRRGSGDVAGAARDYRRAVTLDPSFVPAQAGLARIAYVRGDLDRAIAGYEEVVARYPAAEHLIWLSELLQAAGRTQEADQQRDVVRAIQQLSAANGVNVDLEIALFEADHGDPAIALRAAQAEWERRHSIHVADAMAWALHANGNDRAALAFSRRALHLGTRDALLLYHAGMIRLGLSDSDGALRDLRSALRIDPNFSALHAPIAERTVARLGGAA